MSNPTELPDLDRLEALARAATPGPWAYQEDSDAYTHIVRPTHTPGRIVHHYSQDTSGVVEANARFTAAANPAAVLALIALARRAQPKAEAPQAEAVAWAYECLQTAEPEVWAEFISRTEPWADRWTRNIHPLYTAPAAQQAESGAQALSDAQCDEAAAKAMDRVAASHDMHALHINPDVRAHDDLRRELVRAGAALAAQSQGVQRDEDAEFEKWAISEQLAYQDTHHGVVFFNGSGKQLARQAWKARAALAAKAEAPAPQWGRVDTVADMVRNLLTLDQADPIHAAFPIEFQGKRRMRTRPITISRERVIDGKWIDQTRKDVPYATVVWAKPDERAQQAAAPGALLAILRDVHDTLSSESDSDIDHFEDDEEEREGAPVQYAARKVMEVMDMLKAAPSAPGTPEAPAGWKKALHAAVCAIYFDDSSDFRSALGSVVRHLDADLAGELLSNPKAAYDRSAAQLDGGQGEGKEA